MRHCQFFHGGLRSARAVETQSALFSFLRGTVSHVLDSIGRGTAEHQDAGRWAGPANRALLRLAGLARVIGGRRHTSAAMVPNHHHRRIPQCSRFRRRVAHALDGAVGTRTTSGLFVIRADAGVAAMRSFVVPPDSSDHSRRPRAIPKAAQPLCHLRVLTPRAHSTEVSGMRNTIDRPFKLVKRHVATDRGGRASARCAVQNRRQAWRARRWSRRRTEAGTTRGEPQHSSPQPATT